MKDYNINDCGVVINPDVIAEYKGRRCSGIVTTASKGGKYAYGMKMMADTYGFSSPVTFDCGWCYSTEADMRQAIINDCERHRKDYPDVAEALIKQVRKTRQPQQMTFNFDFL